MKTLFSLIVLIGAISLASAKADTTNPGMTSYFGARLAIVSDTHQPFEERLTALKQLQGRLPAYAEDKEELLNVLKTRVAGFLSSAKIRPELAEAAVILLTEAEQLWPEDVNNIRQFLLTVETTRTREEIPELVNNFLGVEVSEKPENNRTTAMEPEVRTTIEPKPDLSPANNKDAGHLSLTGEAKYVIFAILVCILIVTWGLSAYAPTNELRTLHVPNITKTKIGERAQEMANYRGREISAQYDYYHKLHHWIDRVDFLLKALIFTLLLVAVVLAVYSSNWKIAAIQAVFALIIHFWRTSQENSQQLLRQITDRWEYELDMLDNTLHTVRQLESYTQRGNLESAYPEAIKLVMKKRKEFAPKQPTNGPIANLLRAA